MRTHSHTSQDEHATSSLMGILAERFEFGSFQRSRCLAWEIDPWVCLCSFVRSAIPKLASTSSRDVRVATGSPSKAKRLHARPASAFAAPPLGTVSGSASPGCGRG